VYPSAPWQGASIQDHGELWSQSADVVTEEGAHSVKVTTRWQGVTLPYAFTRTITLSNGFGVLHTNYQVTNTSDEPVHFVWCIHPLLAIEPGMELLLPAAADFHVNAAAPEDLVSGRTNLKYPFKADGLNLPALPKTDAGIAIKLWSDPLPAGEGMASLRAKDGEFKMRWDVNEIPQVAAWLNLGKWAADGGTPYYNLGLEPCIGAQDSLNDAVNQYNLFANLPPRGSRSWNLEIELTA
jgi:galactose mutarotase-like enzyme